MTPGLADVRYAARHPFARAGLWAAAVTGAIMLVVLAVMMLLYIPLQRRASRWAK